MPRVGSSRRISRLGSACGRSPALSRAKPPLPPPFSAPGSPSPRSLSHTPAVRAPARPPALLLPFPAVCAPARAPGGRRLPPARASGACPPCPAFPCRLPAPAGPAEAAGAWRWPGRGAARCSGSPRTAAGDRRRGSAARRGARCRQEAPREKRRDPWAPPQRGARGRAVAPTKSCRGRGNKDPAGGSRRGPAVAFPALRRAGMNAAAARPSLPAGGGQGTARPGGGSRSRPPPRPAAPGSLRCLGTARGARATLRCRSARCCV